MIKADALWCKHCDVLHPRTSEFYYFRPSGTVLGCKTYRKRISLAWSNSHKNERITYNRAYARRKKLKMLSAYQGFLSGQKTGK